MTSECRRCGEYEYFPVRVAALNGNVETVEGLAIFKDGFENIDHLCRDCSEKLTRFMDGAELEPK